MKADSPVKPLIISDELESPTNMRIVPSLSPVKENRLEVTEPRRIKMSALNRSTNPRNKKLNCRFFGEYDATAEEERSHMVSEFERTSLLKEKKKEEANTPVQGSSHSPSRSAVDILKQS